MAKDEEIREGVRGMMKDFVAHEKKHGKYRGGGQFGPKRKEVAKKMKIGIHRVGDNPSRFVHKGPKGQGDLYETWKGGKQHIQWTKEPKK